MDHGPHVVHHKGFSANGFQKTTQEADVELTLQLQCAWDKSVKRAKAWRKQKWDPEIIQSHVMGRADDMENEQKAEKARLAISCVLRVQGNNMKMWLFLWHTHKKKQLKKIEG